MAGVSGLLDFIWRSARDSARLLAPGRAWLFSSILPCPAWLMRTCPQSFQLMQG